MLLQWIIIYLGIFLLVSLLHTRDDRAWLRALIITLFFYLALLFVDEYGIYASVPAFLVGLVLVMRVMGYGLGAAFLMVVAISFMDIVIGWGMDKYFK